MINKITPDELAIFEALANPINCTEILFSDLGSLTEFSKDKYSKVRMYQYPMLSYESLFFENPNLSNKENFKIKKGLGDCVNFGGRLTGKTLIGILVDMTLSVFHKTFKWGITSSCDATKIRGVMETVLSIFDNHPILKEWKCKHKSHPAYLATFGNNCKIESVNNNVAGKDPGKNWFQKHADKNWEEEASFLNDSISNKRLMAQSEYGMVERLTGMANFKKQSPIGRKFFDLKNENLVTNLPSYANETWDDEKDDAAQQEFGGKQCFDDETEILTDNGWKNILNINNNDLVVSWDMGKNIAKYQNIKNIFKYDYDGKLYSYDNLVTDFKVTLNHKFPFKTLKKDFRLIDVETILSHKAIKKNYQLYDTNFCLECGTKLDKSYKKKQKYFCSYGCKNKYTSQYEFYPVDVLHLNQNMNWVGREKNIIKIGKIKYNMDYFLQFLGWFVSEGCVCEYKEKRGIFEWIHYRIQISQEKSKEYIQEIQNILYNLNLRDKYSHGCFVFTNKVLGKYLLETCLKYARNKKVPAFIRNLSKRQINLFLDTFNKGDGDGKREEYYTSSKQLASDLQELIIKSGNYATISHRKDRDQYLISERKSIREPAIYVNKIKEIDYKGKIWCVETEPFHTIYIRRNNKCMWSGNSPGYRTQILGQVVDDGNSVYDIERIRECYKRDKDGDPILVKSFEINRNNFYRFKEIIIVDKPNNAESSWICLDKGEGNAPTEIIVLFKIGDIYKYEYNITNFRLSPDEDNVVVEYIIEQLKANVVGIDTTSGGGKAMLSYLAKKYPENIVGVSFNEKIDIDFEKDEQNNIKYDSAGNVIYKSEFIVDWSIQRIKHLFYNKKIQALYDMKLDTQFDSIIVMKSGQRTVYGSKMANHLHQAFQVFAITLWNYEFKNIQPIQDKKNSFGAC
jgi:hypothetical protein